MKSKVTVVTPSLAKKWLEKNLNNRNISKRRVAMYSSDMKRGAWIVTHQGIAFDEEGNLLDGQHRLLAVIDANVNVTMLVSTGVPKEINSGAVRVRNMDVLDGGLPRNIGQRLKFAYNIPNANLVAAIVNAIKTVCVPANGASAISTSQTLAIRELYADSIDTVLGRGWPGSDRKSAMLGVLVMVNDAMPNTEREFSTGLISMDSLKPKSPIAMYRRWLLNGSGSYANSTGRLRLMRVTANACMKLHNGQTVEKLYETEEALNWLRASQKAKVRKVCELFGA